MLYRLFVYVGRVGGYVRLYYVDVDVGSISEHSNSVIC